MANLPVSSLLLFAVLAAAAPHPSAATDRPHQLAAEASQQKRGQCPTPNKLDAAHCHQQFPDGCAKPSSQYDAYLSFLKNQTISPAAADAQIKRTFNSLADFATLDRSTQPFGPFFGNGAAAGHASQLAQSGVGEIDIVLGYLYYADSTGAEACNCGLTEADDTDIHIGIGFDPALAAKIATGKFIVTTNPSRTDDAKRTSIVVEMTPHYRARFHPQWKQPKIQALHGRRVKVIGQLLADADHNDKKQDCAFTNKVAASCWRASIFELHPVTRFFVCKEGKSCSDAKSPNWQEIP
jgi:hypothetical protein